jgi:CBS domain-containing protein
MQVSDAMSRVVVQVGPDHTLRQAAQLMSSRRVGSAIVADPDGSGVGIITERDVLNAIGTGLDPDEARAVDRDNILGVISVRDILRVWVSDGATVTPV